MGIHAKIPTNLFLHKATKKDVETTYRWASNPEITKYLSTTKEIDWESHKKWFYGKIEEEDCEYYMLFEKEIPVGSIKFEIQEKGAAGVNYLIDPSFQGRGFGKLLLALGVEEIKTNRPEVKFVGGLVRNENLASIKVFSALDFSIEYEGAEQTAFIKEI